MKLFELSPLVCRSERSMALVLVTTFSVWAAATSTWASDSRFVPSASGEEVTDTQTGLIWRRCVEGQTWAGNTCVYSSLVRYTWEEALARAKSTAVSTRVAWRLPNVKELQSLVNRGVLNPAIDSGTFPNIPEYTPFWTSTPYAGDASNAWSVEFSYGGNVVYLGRSSYLYVRLVRDGQ